MNKKILKCDIIIFFLLVNTLCYSTSTWTVDNDWLYKDGEKFL